MALTQVPNSMLAFDGGPLGMRNRIINGDMRINQRATSVTASGYTVDRFAYFGTVASKATVAQDTSVYPVGFNASLKVLSSSAYTVGSTEEFEVYQSIEGLNVADLGWGTANAKTVTLSFQVYSSLTGTFGGALQNSASNRSYPFTYTISTANTWTTVSITVAGDTSGTWLTTNGIGIAVYFGLGVGSTKSGTAGAWAGAYYTSATSAVSVVGTNAATWYLTGVQLEVGSVATPFERQIYSTQLAQCQRYLPAWSGSSNYCMGIAGSTTTVYALLPFLVSPRTAPTGITTTATSTFNLSDITTFSGAPSAIAFSSASSSVTTVAVTASGLIANRPFIFGGNSASSLIYGTGCEL